MGSFDPIAYYFAKKALKAAVPAPRLVLEEHAVGTLTADGTEQDVVELTALGTLEGWIDLASMAAGDTVVLRIYVRLGTGKPYRLYNSASYSGAQTKPAVHIVKLAAKHGLKVTLQQTIGAYKTFDYNFIRGVMV